MIHPSQMSYPHDRADAADPGRHVPDLRGGCHADRPLGGVRAPHRENEDPEQDEARDERERAEHVEREKPLVEAHVGLIV